MINRCSIIVRPQKPFIDWAGALEDTDEVPDAETEPSLYLIPEYEDDVDGWKIVSECYDIIFEAELEAWYADDTTWPANRTFTMFREWFDVVLCSCIYDLCEGPIVDDDVDA